MPKKQTHKKLTIWLIGSSQGIGFELCKNLLINGHEVIASSRSAQSTQELLDLQNEHKKNLHLLDVDISDDESVKVAINIIEEKFSHLNCWINNAGVYYPMSIDEWNFDHYQAMNNINYLGVIRVMTALKPLFIKNGGKWLWNCSLSSDFGLPYGGGYSAPKAALVNLAEALQPELKLCNIDLQIINHGFVKTRLTDKNDFPMLGLMQPETAAKNIAKAVTSNQFETRFPWNLATILGLIKRLPKSWALALTKKALK